MTKTDIEENLWLEFMHYNAWLGRIQAGTPRALFWEPTKTNFWIWYEQQKLTPPAQQEKSDDR